MNRDLDVFAIIKYTLIQKIVVSVDPFHSQPTSFNAKYKNGNSKTKKKDCCLSPIFFFHEILAKNSSVHTTKNKK